MVVDAVDVPDVANAASPASMPITMVTGTVHERNRQNASTGPMPDWAASFDEAERNPLGAGFVVRGDAEVLIVVVHRPRNGAA
jgi:hypothetical protein